jgi:colicin import membrane protein
MMRSSPEYAAAMRAGDDSSRLAFFFGISLLFHLIFIASALFLPEYKPPPRMGAGAITVSLVSLPGSPDAAAPAPAPQAPPAPAVRTAAAPPKQVAKPPEKPAAEVKPLPPPESKTVSLAPAPKKAKVKKSLKKKTLNRPKMIDQALSEVQQNVKASEMDSVRRALDRLEKKVAQSDAGALQSGPAARGAGTGAGSRGTGAGGAEGRRQLEMLDLYKIEVAFQVERHWAFPEPLAGESRSLQALVVFSVLPSGEITDIRFTQRSGNAYLDDSAYKAIVKASPVSPHPDAIKVPSVTVALRFTPQGLRK